MYVFDVVGSTYRRMCIVCISMWTKIPLPCLLLHLNDMWGPFVIPFHYPFFPNLPCVLHLHGLPRWTPRPGSRRPNGYPAAQRYFSSAPAAPRWSPVAHHAAVLVGRSMSEPPSLHGHHQIHLSGEKTGLVGKKKEKRTAYIVKKIGNRGVLDPGH